MYGQYRQQRRTACHRPTERKESTSPPGSTGEKQAACREERKGKQPLPKEKGAGVRPCPCQKPVEAVPDLSQVSCGVGGSTAMGSVALPGFLQDLFPKGNTGDLLALLILLLLLSEGREDSQNTVLTLLIFLLL